MKAILEFNLDEMGDRLNHEIALSANDLKRIIVDFDDYLRSLVKYEDKETISTEETREKLWDLIKQYEVERLFS